MPELDDFEQFARRMLVLDNGRPMILEEFQRTMLADYFAGARETLCLLPKGNYKSTTIAAVGLYELLTVEDAEIIVAAAAREQAGILLRQATGFVRRSPELTARLLLKSREIERRDHRGRIRVLTSDEDTGDGTIPTRVFVDELHRWKTLNLYATLHGGLHKRDARLMSITTAGSDQEGPLWKARLAALELGSRRDGAYLRAGSEHFVLHEWSLEPGADPDDLEAVKRCNPASAVTVELLRERHASPMMNPWDWRRFSCCLWSSAQEPWLRPNAWEGCCDPALELPTNGRVVLGVDIGRKHHTSAIIAAANTGERIVVRAWIFESPGRGEESTDFGVIEAKIRELAATYSVAEIAYDPWSFARSAQLLGDEGLPMVEFPQNNSRMCAASARLLEAIKSGCVAHDGDPVLAAHVAAGATTETERGWRLTKRKATSSIDALIALVMAVERAEWEPPAEPVPLVAFR